MFTKDLSYPRRVVFAVVGLTGLISAGVCGFLALTEPDLPIAARLGLGTGTLFGIAWSVVAARICWNGAINRQQDSRNMATMVWVFTVLMMVFFAFHMCSEYAIMSFLPAVAGNASKEVL